MMHGKTLDMDENLIVERLRRFHQATLAKLSEVRSGIAFCALLTFTQFNRRSFASKSIHASGISSQMQEVNWLFDWQATFRRKIGSIGCEPLGTQ